MGNDLSKIAESENASIVIVGAGYGGVAVARELQQSGKVTIIHPRDYLFHTVGAARAIVEPSFTRKLMIPLIATFGKSFVKDEVVKIDKECSKVVLKSGKAISYSHLVLATGSTCAIPVKLTDAQSEVSQTETMEIYADINKQVQKAKSIVCIGGGSVGVELAGELKTDYPDKKVAVIHSNETLASHRLNKKVQTSLHKILTERGIELMLNEKVSNLADVEVNKCVNDQKLVTESGKEITCDLVFDCTESKPNTDQFREALGSAVMENGLIKVDPCLRVEGYENIFAIGDITDIDEEKLSLATVEHAKVVSNNIKASFADKKLNSYRPSTFTMMVSVGRDGGVSELAGVTFGEAITRNIKSAGLSVDKIWGDMGQKVPK